MGAGAGFLLILSSMQSKEMLPAVTAPSFDRKGASVFNYEQKVELRRQVRNLDQATRASALIL